MNFSIVASVGRSIIKNRMFLNSISAGSGRLAFMAVIYSWDYTPIWKNIDKAVPMQPQELYYVTRK